jgi:hypothetical protein
MDMLKKKVGIRILEIEGYRVELDLANQVLGIDVPGDCELGEPWNMDIPDGFEMESTVSPTLKGCCQPGFASAAMLAQKAKHVDDRIYASVDLAAQRGYGTCLGKAQFLKTILRQAGPLPPQLFAAALLGKLDVEVPDAIQQQVNSARQQFLEDDRRAKPIGFYSWSDELRQVFQQDRMLQSPLENINEVEALARAIQDEPTSRQFYDDYLELASRLTNPFVADNPDLRKLLAQLDQGAIELNELQYFLIPPSSAHETELFKKLYGDAPIPEGFSLADEMVRRISRRDLSLQPTADSGWYDYQTWSLEPLLRPEATPEAARLELDGGYRQQLVELFKGILTLTRETHIKQLDFPEGGAAGEVPPSKPVLHVVPELASEPLYSYYLRRAIGYRFLWQCLANAFGPKGIAEIPTVTSEGRGAQTLGEMISETSALFHGAAVVVSRQLGGLDPAGDAQRMVEHLEIDSQAFSGLGSGRGEDADAEQFLRWTESQHDDDVFCDSRAMVPVFYDLQREQTKVWAFLGWASRPATISFAKPPEAKVFDEQGQRSENKVRLEFEVTTLPLPYPVMAEVYVSEILNREEFREHCDRYQTQRAIIDHLN